jgi:hypothetical protein
MATPKPTITKVNLTRGAKTSAQTLTPKSDKEAGDKRTASKVETKSPKQAAKSAPKAQALAAAKKTEPKRALKASPMVAKPGASAGRAKPAPTLAAAARPTTRPTTRPKTKPIPAPQAAPPSASTARGKVQRPPKRQPSGAELKAKRGSSQDVAANAQAENLSKPAPASNLTVAINAPASQAGGDQHPAQVQGLLTVLALSVDEGLFLIAAAAASFETVRAFARYESDPLPRFVSEGTYFAAQTTKGGPVIYTTFLPWPSAPAGPLQLGCITTSGRKPLLSVNSLAWAELQPDASTELLKRFGRALLPAAKAVLPERHELRLALEPVEPPVKAVAPAKTTVLCHFDGVIDGLAHGWVHDTSQPGKALEVEILHQGEVVARGLADRYRDDLERNGIGNGCHHFRLSLSYTLFDSQPHVLEVRVPVFGDALLCPPVTCSLVNSQPAHLDAIPRAQTLALARKLERRGNFSQPGGDQALLAAFDQHGLLQETWLLDEARAGYIQLAEALGDNALCHCKIAETWLLDYRLPEALDAYAAATRLDPQMPWAHLGIGNVLRLQSQPLAALAAYRTALAIEPRLSQAEQRVAAVEADAVCARAAQLAQAGDKTSATALLRATVLQYPDHQRACDILYELLRDSQPPGQFVDAARSTPSAQADRARHLLDAMLDEVEQRFTKAAAAR